MIQSMFEDLCRQNPRQRKAKNVPQIFCGTFFGYIRSYIHSQRRNSST